MFLHALHTEPALLCVLRFCCRHSSVATDIERRAAPVASKTASDKKHLRVNVRLSGIDHSVLDSYVELLRRTAVGVLSVGAICARTGLCACAFVTCCIICFITFRVP